MIKYLWGYHNVTKVLKMCISKINVKKAYLRDFYGKVCKKKWFSHRKKDSYPQVIHILWITLRKLGKILLTMWISLNIEL